MTKVRVGSFTISLDGYGAGANQSVEQPLGSGGEELHDWLVETRTFRSTYGDAGGEEGTNDDFASRGFENVGAWIMGRNMFAPSRGAWPDDGWKGWWGDNPPYHVPVFVLTHHARAPLEMEGGTVFHFVTDGIHDALKRAKVAAQGKDIRLGGGVATVRQYLAAKLIDEMHLVIAPALLGRGENLLAGIDMVSLGYKCTEHASSEHAAHIVLTR